MVFRYFFKKSSSVAVNPNCDIPREFQSCGRLMVLKCSVSVSQSGELGLEKTRYENVVYDFGKGGTVIMSLGTLGTI
jgi:hypothetical protein